MLPEVKVRRREVPERVSIVHSAFLDLEGAFLLVDFLIDHDDYEILAESESTKALSRYAFGHGASEVRHDYDLSLER